MFCVEIGLSIYVEKVLKLHERMDSVVSTGSAYLTRQRIFQPTLASSVSMSTTAARERDYTPIPNIACTAASGGESVITADDSRAGGLSAYPVNYDRRSDCKNVRVSIFSSADVDFRR